MSLEMLRQELRAYDESRSYRASGGENFKSPFWELMDAYAAAHPGLDAVQLKAAQYEMIAENFHPTIFRNSPFFSEMGLNVAESDGIPFFSAGGWLFRRNMHLFRAHRRPSTRAFPHCGSCMKSAPSSTVSESTCSGAPITCSATCTAATSLTGQT
jgi:hypothetical protein